MSFRERIGSVLGLAQKRPLRSVPSEKSWFVLQDWGGTSFQSDVTIERDSVLANWAVFSCMSLIAGDIGKCNLQIVAKAGGIWNEYRFSPYSDILEQPNPFQTRQQFIEQWIYSKLSWGNTYILKQRDRKGTVTRLYVLDPCRVNPLIATTGEVFYQVLQDDLSEIFEDYAAIPASEIIHDRWNCLFHPLVGLSPIFANGLAATQGLKIQQNSAKFFTNMSRPSGILSAPGSIGQDTADRLKSSWEKNYGGDKIGRVAILGDDLRFQSLGINADDAQMVEQLKLSAETICSTFHVPTFKIGAGTIPAGQKVEDLNAIYYADCLQALTEAIENLLRRGLGLKTSDRGQDLAVRFDLNDLLKMDAQTQIDVLQKAVGAGVMAPNEGRARLNLPPVAGGDSPYMQQQNYSLEALAKRDAQADPFTPAGGKQNSVGAAAKTGYLGVWQRALAGAYERGDFVTDRGSLWSCVRASDERPGEGNAWQLAAKGGGYGKEADVIDLPMLTDRYIR